MWSGGRDEGPTIKASGRAELSAKFWGEWGQHIPDHYKRVVEGRALAKILARAARMHAWFDWVVKISLLCEFLDAPNTYVSSLNINVEI